MGEQQPVPAEAFRPRQVTHEEQRTRGRVADVLNHWPILPAELRVTQQQNRNGNVVSSIREAERLHTEQGCGVIYAYNHFDRTDPLLALYIQYWASEILRGIPTLSPIEQKQFEQNEWVVAPLAAKTGNTLKPIVTEDTINQYGVLREAEEKKVFPSKSGKDMHESDGFQNYITAAKDALMSGESVLLPIAAGRRPSLYTSATLQDTRSRDLGPLSVLSMKIGGKKEKVQKVAIAFIGIGLKGVRDYSKRRGFNFAHRAEITFGPVVTLEELRGLAYTFDTTIDEAGRTFLGEIVPDAYRDPTSVQINPTKSDKIKSWISQRFSASPEQS